MRFLRNIPIERKLTIITMVTSGVALLLACASFVTYEQVMFRRTMVRDLLITARMIGDNSSASLSFNESGSAKQTLNSLSAQSHILGAAIYGKDGKLFAQYQRAGFKGTFLPPPVRGNSHRFERDHLELFQSIQLAGEPAGTVYIQSDLEAMAARWRLYALIGLGVMLTSSMVAFLLARKLQRVISEPVSHLARIAGLVASDQNYAVRAVKQGEDELGRLIDGFNEMLSQIQARDAQLHSAHNDLEKRVEERTLSLQQEVTERKRSEAALVESQRFLQSSLDALSAHIGILNETGDIIAVNVVWKESAQGDDFLGHDCGVGTNYLRVCDDPLGAMVSNGAKVAKGIREVMGGQSDEFELEYPCPNGKATRWFVVRVTRFAGQGPVRIVVAHENITQRKRAEESLLQLSRAIEQSADTVVITDDAGLVKYVNPAFESLTGYGIEEVIGKSTRLLKSGEHDAAFYRGLWQTIRSGKSFRAEFTNRKKNGELYTEEKSITPVIDQSGAITHFVATGRDITDRKRNEAQMQALNKQLLETSRQAGMAEVATGVLHNVGNVLNSVNVSTTLIVDQIKKCKSANLAKIAELFREHAQDLGRFISSDPKGRQLPGYIEQLSLHLASEQQATLQELEALRKNIEHIKDIVAMQQSYAKVSGVTETLNITDLVEDTLRMNAGAMLRHDVHVIREFEDVPPITVEKHKVLQILVNLVRNAKYACDDSGRDAKEIRVRVTRREGWVSIAIADNGIGIPPENLTRIFSHGFTTKKDGHGFGLHSGALAARELGGTLTVHSDGLGRGATFTLELPRETIKESQPKAA
jgi:PAS domain S-box-containing protein